MTFASQKTLLFFLSDGDEHSHETFDLGMPNFYDTSQLKIDAKEFFIQFMNTM